MNSGRPHKERKTLLRRKVVINKNENKARPSMSSKNRVPDDVGATLKEEDILLVDNLNEGAEERNSTGGGDTNSTVSPFFFNLPTLPALSDLPLGIGWVADVFDSFLPTVRHTQMPPHILL